MWTSTGLYSPLRLTACLSLYTAADYVVPFNADDTTIFLWNLTQVLTDHALDSILTTQVRAHKSLYAYIDKKKPNKYCYNSINYLYTSFWKTTQFCPSTYMWARRSRIEINLISINCHHTGTFPAVHSLQHPLVVAVIWGHPLSAHAVRGKIPVPLLLWGHCHRLSVQQTIILFVKYPCGFSPWWQLPLLLSVPLAFSLSVWLSRPVATTHSALHKPMISLPSLPLNHLTPSLSSALLFSSFPFFLLLSLTFFRS